MDPAHNNAAAGVVRMRLIWPHYLGLLVATAVAPAHAQVTVDVIHQFVNGAGGGYAANPVTGHQDGADASTWALYGTTRSGGPGQAGIFYKLTPPAQGNTRWTETRLYLFGSVAADSNPVRSLVFDSAGAAYGILSNTLTQAPSSIFKLTPPPAGEYFWRKTTVYTFSSADQGAPFSLALDNSGALYVDELNQNLVVPGTYGSIVRMTPPASGQGPWNATVLHNFTAAGGEIPMIAPVLDASGAIYGMTDTDDSHANSRHVGLFYKLTPPRTNGASWTFTSLYTFTDPDSASSQPMCLALSPSGGVFGIDSNILDNSLSYKLFQLHPPTNAGSTWSRTDLTDIGLVAGYNSPGLSILDRSGSLYLMFENAVNPIMGTPVDGSVLRYDPPTSGHPQGLLQYLAVAYTGGYTFPDYSYREPIPSRVLVRSPSGRLFSSVLHADNTGTNSYDDDGIVYMITSNGVPISIGRPASQRR